MSLHRKRVSGEHRHSHTWKKAQEYERQFWIRFIRDELGFKNRDQMVGFRLCEGRIRLCGFGLRWNDFMYSMDSPYISGRVLDVGSSVVSVFEECRSVSVVAIDPLLQGLARWLPEIVVLGKINNCEYRSCTIQDVVDTDFDVVWCNNVLDHTDDWQDIVYHFSRVLKQRGLLFLGTDVRSRPGLLNAGHISVFTADEVVTELAANGFEVVWQSPRTDLAQYRFNVRATLRQTGGAGTDHRQRGKD